MVLTVFLVVALGCLILGLTLASTGWLIASLAASVLAAFVLLRSWGSIAESRTKQRTAKAQRDRAGGRRRDKGGGEGDDVKFRRSGKQDAAAGSAEVSPPPPEQADGSAGSTTVEVVVIDGMPDYHNAGCARLANVETETIPLEQAIEDGFAPCARCKPPTQVPAASSAPPAPATAGDDEVLVVDGQPEYHATGCALLTGQPAVAVPLAQAVEDGFVPCTVCAPKTADVPTQAAPARGSTVRQVWVADGYPEYHVEGCRELRGRAAEAIPHEQAVEDGFVACSVCRPEGADEAPTVTEPRLGITRPVWVVDGQPDYHVESCPVLDGSNAEAIPHDQAVEDGFAPCTVCDPEAPAEPATAAASAEPATAAASAEPAAEPPVAAPVAAPAVAAAE